jgi:tRNA-specific adenosine deaminase 1
MSEGRAVRHVEKRRTSTCLFADRVATAAIAAYHGALPDDERPHPTCVAALLLHELANDALSVIALGIGTKFLKEEVLQQERTTERPYGTRVRDMHAEVLCRRAFRRYLSEVILDKIAGKEESASTAFLEGYRDSDGLPRWRLASGFTFHAYFSSTPCGNATLKKFAKLSKEVFQPDLKLWPMERHPPQAGHSVRMGQFALLVKHDASTRPQDDDDDDDSQRPANDTRRSGGNTNGDNVPIGTAPVNAGQGSLHTCSDKICRWNVLGWQGSLLGSLMEDPLHVTSITVGRKLSGVCCRRAICCRIAPDTEACTGVHHPAVMGTAVYLDPDAVVTPTDSLANDVQFAANRAWAWWPGLSRAHAVDRRTGYAVIDPIADEGKEKQVATSPICTYQLVEVFRSILATFRPVEPLAPQTLTELRTLKGRVSLAYENRKDELLRHPVMKSWSRRTDIIDD